MNILKQIIYGSLLIMLLGLPINAYAVDFSGYLLVWHTDKIDKKIWNTQIDILNNQLKNNPGFIIPMPSVGNMILISKDDIKNYKDLLDKSYSLQMNEPLQIHLNDGMPTPMVFRTPVKDLLVDVTNLSNVIINIDNTHKTPYKGVVKKDMLRVSSTLNKIDLINMLATPPYNKRYDFN